MIALDSGLDDALVRAAAPHLPAHLRSGKPLVEAIMAVSDRYLHGRATLGRAAGDSAAELAARALFFLGADLCKVQVPLAELDAEGLLGTPARVLDLGAGVGTQTIGLISWLGARARFTVELVDRDLGTLALARPLVEAAAAASGGKVEVTTRTADLEAPTAGPGRYDLILMGTALNELHLAAPDPIAARAALLGALLPSLTEAGSLIVIEPALRETSRALEQVRDRLLAAGQGHVFAPCTRGAPCPALADERDFCHEDRTFQPSPRLARLIASVGLREHGLKFAYLTLRRAAACHAPGPGWSRVVSAALGSKGKTEWFVCGEGGRVRLRVLTRERGSVREIARDLDRGDAVLAPAGVPTERRPRRP